jgi:ABC-type protease/lipase transport system fused ATPase/permease subunit
VQFRQGTTLSTILHRCCGGIVAVGILSALINLLVLAVSIYSVQVYHRVLTGGSISRLAAVSLIALVAIALNGAF